MTNEEKFEKALSFIHMCNVLLRTRDSYGIWTQSVITLRDIGEISNREAMEEIEKGREDIFENSV